MSADCNVLNVNDIKWFTMVVTFLFLGTPSFMAKNGAVFRLAGLGTFLEGRSRQLSVRWKSKRLLTHYNKWRENVLNFLTYIARFNGKYFVQIIFYILLSIKKINIWYIKEWCNGPKITNVWFAYVWKHSFWEETRHLYLCKEEANVNIETELNSRFKLFHPYCILHDTKYWNNSHWQPSISTLMLGCLFHCTVWNLMNLATIGSSRYECFTEYESVLPSKTCKYFFFKKAF